MLKEDTHIKTTLCNEWQKSQHALLIFSFSYNPLPFECCLVLQSGPQFQANYCFGGRWDLQVTY